MVPTAMDGKLTAYLHCTLAAFRHLARRNWNHHPPPEASALHERRRRPTAPRAKLGAASGGGRLVDREPDGRRRPRRGVTALRNEHDAVIVARRLDAHQLVAHVAQHASRIAFERVAPTAGPRLL